jgi:hypothetical protein
MSAARTQHSFGLLGSLVLVASSLAACPSTETRPCDRVEDEDGDGFGSFFVEDENLLGFRTASRDCVLPAGVLADCDDTDAQVFPGAPDLPGDNVDQNCGCLDGALGVTACFLDGEGEPAEGEPAEGEAPQGEGEGEPAEAEGEAGEGELG